MKAFLLAAGVGSRLRPITDTVPKCMVPVEGLPLIEYWLTAFRSIDVEEVLVNTHHHADLVEDYLRPVARVRTVREPVLLGSAGTLLAHQDWVKDEDFFLVCNADNLTDFDLSNLVTAQHKHNPIATLAVRRTENPQSAGIIEVDADGVVTGFEEKPRAPKSDLMNAGIYAFRPDALDLIEALPPCDIGYDLLPKLVARGARTVPATGYFRDIGTVESYELAQREWPER